MGGVIEMGGVLEIRQMKYNEKYYKCQTKNIEPR